MSTYLLLRSNKQSGPYTLDQIRAIGLKAYDLIWIEGRSAAWRYPGEVDEFKSFAPIVEEQPYDRFYKRNPVKSTLQVVDQKMQVSSSPSFIEQNRPSIYASLPVLEKMIPSKEPLLQKESAAPVSEPAYISAEKKPSSLIPDRSAEVVLLDEKFSQPLDEIKKKYVEQMLNRKKEPLQFRHLFIIAALVFGLILLFSGGIFIGLSMNRRGINSTTKDLAKDEAGAGSQQTEYHSHPIPVSTSLPDQANNKTESENDDYSQFLAEIQKNELKDNQKKKTPATAEKNFAPSVVTSNHPGLDSETSGTQAEQRPTLHRTDAVVDKEAVKNNIFEYISLSNNKYYVGTFGGISDVQITVNNRSLFPLDLVLVEVQYIQTNKKVFKTENVYFKNIDPGSSLVQEAPKSSRGIKIQYRITLINSKELGLSYSAL
jgi:hypothetical protein